MTETYPCLLYDCDECPILEDCYKRGEEAIIEWEDRKDD